MTKRFDEGMRLLRRKGEDRENGFCLLQRHAVELLDELIEAFRGEEAENMRVLLLTLIGEARSPRALPILAEHLDHEDESLAYWAVRGLEMLDTKEARTVLYRHRANNAHT
ncbi:HEAT repeat-containing protein [Lentzea waywayandensis]|uniref:HEAT repeat-containing protein n=1 Tax=Lentzea waywayandensis TaxID=84724 RepID=A0A1I6FBA6_9PSEU|nr:HEAT repeat domain-containing protein [Lentzea waywayandensis]SFR27057.1 HEAT repeat-containing protein [Lentzea waywayandensis]